VRHPVEERHYHGLRSHGWREVGDGLILRGRLDRQQHDLRGLGQLSGHHQVRPDGLPGIGSSPWPDDPQPALAQLPGAARVQLRWPDTGCRPRTGLRLDEVLVPVDAQIPWVKFGLAARVRR
jgi:hypothetical protein